MQKFIASAPNAEIMGRALLALQTSILYTEYRNILEKYGLDKIDPDQWYSQQAVLNVHRDLLRTPNASRKIVSIGVKIAENFPFPEGSSIDEVLQIFSDLHLQVHRNISDEDRFSARRTSDYSFEIINSSPYPDDLVYGYVYSLMTRFCPAGTYPVLQYQNPQKVNSDTSMAFELTW